MLTSFAHYCRLREGLLGPDRPLAPGRLRTSTTPWPRRPSPHLPRRRLKGEPTLKLGLPQLKLPPLPKLKDPVTGR
jgi:hypothetical protein